MRVLSLLLLAILSIPLPVFAAPAPSCPPLVAPAVLIEQAKIASSQGWPRAETFRLVTIGGGKNANQAHAIYHQLLDAKCKKVLVNSAGTQASELIKPAGDARDLLLLITLPQERAQTELLALWDQGADGFRKLTLLAESSPAGRTLAQMIVGRKLQQAWATSNLSSNYEPLAGTIKARDTMIKAIAGDPELQKWERNLLYQSIVAWDKYSVGAMPDHLYAFVKPPA